MYFSTSECTLFPFKKQVLCSFIWSYLCQTLMGDGICTSRIAVSATPSLYIRQRWGKVVTIFHLEAPLIF